MNTEIINKHSEILIDAPRFKKKSADEGKIFVTTVAFNHDTYERLDRVTKGARSTCFDVLINFALDTLEKNGQKIIVKE